MTDVAVWVANLPGALERIAAFGVGPLALGTVGLLLLCLLRSPLRLVGFGGIALATIWALSVPQPDVLIAGDGRAMAVRTESGRLVMIRTGSDSFALQEWLAADGDNRTRDDPALGEGIRCDHAGCVGRLAGGRLIALTNTAEAFDEDCRLAAVVAGWRRAPPGCAAVVIDGAVLEKSGAVALRRDVDGFVVTPTRPAGYDRPWAPAPAQADDTNPDANKRAHGDATPRPQDLEVDD